MVLETSLTPACAELADSYAAGPKACEFVQRPVTGTVPCRVPRAHVRVAPQ